MPRRYRIGRDDVPDSAVVVARPTRYANPWSAGDVLHGAVLTAQDAVDMYEQALKAGRLQVTVAEVQRVFFGQDIACYCDSAAACHGDVLLAVAAGLWNDDPTCTTSGRPVPTHGGGTRRRARARTKP